MSLNLINRQRTVSFHIAWVRPLMERAVDLLELPEDAEITVMFLSDRAIQKLNAQWRGLDRPTDCLSFPMDDEGPFEDIYLGDIAISVQTALK